MGAGMPMLARTQNVVHNDSRDAGPASWHDEAPRGLRFPERNLMLNRSAGSNRASNPFGKLGKASRCQKGAPAEATAITSRLGGPGRQTRTGAAPRGLRHPSPLNRGVHRGVRQHKHPVEGPATGKVADPTAGCGVCACGYGYPEHVATSCPEGVSGKPKNPHYKVLWPEWPLPVAKPVDGATLILIYVDSHPTALHGCEPHLMATCRVPWIRRLLTTLHSSDSLRRTESGCRTTAAGRCPSQPDKRCTGASVRTCSKPSLR